MKKEEVETGDAKYDKFKEGVVKHIKEEVSQGIEQIEDAVCDQVEDFKEEMTQVIENSFSGQVENMIDQVIDDRVNHRLRKELPLHMKTMQSHMVKGFYEFQEKLKYYKMLYGFLVVSGFMLFWFGAFRILAHVPSFDSGVLPTVIGTLLMSLTGTLYYKLVGDK